MKRKICGATVCLILILTALVGIPTVQAVDPYDPSGIVRIKLSMGEITQTPVVVDGNYTIAENENVVLARGDYTVEIAGGNFRLSNSSGTLFTGDTITFIQREATPEPNNYITLDNATHGLCNYLGNLHFSIYDGFIRVINHIYIEEYLYGVVPYEMSNSWPIEALKAQAVTARTYAMGYINSGGDYDMVDTASRQTYHGYVEAYTNAIAAVDGTAKQTLVSEGEFVQTFYAASNGGQIDIPQHRWTLSNPVLPYHVIKVDPYDIANPYSKEETLIFPKVFSETQSVQYTSDTYQIYEVKDIDPAVYAGNALRYIKIMSIPSVVEAGYIAAVTDDIEIVGVNSITPHTHEGNHGLKDDYYGTNTCTCFGFADFNMTVLAQKYVEDVEGFLYLGDVNDDGGISITDYTLLRLHILELSELTEDQITRADINGDGAITITDYTMIRLDILELAKIHQSELPGTLVQEEVTVDFTIDMHEFDKSDGLYRAFFSAKLILFAVEETETGWNIYQRRFGHGIGMSQRGAQQMAMSVEDGGFAKLYNEILLFYYPNTEFYTLLIEKVPLTPIVAPEPTPTPSV